MTLHIPFRRLAPLVIALCSVSVFATPTVKEFDGKQWKDFTTTMYSPNDVAYAHDDGIDLAFDKIDDVETNGVYFAHSGDYLIANFTGKSEDPSKTKVYVSEIVVDHVGASTFSLWTSEDGSNWTLVPDAHEVQLTGKRVFKPANQKNQALYVKYVVDSTARDDLLQELRIKGWWTSEPTNISRGKVARTIFFRSGATRGRAGFNGGHYSDSMFDGDFTFGLYQNSAGAELVVPTTTPSLPPDSSAAMPWYVTEVKVGHLGNTQYSLYYTTDPEPANILSYATDPRQWTAIDGATGVQEAGTKKYNVNKNATAIKYVFDTAKNWTQSACELEVWAKDPDDLPCTHPNVDQVTWAVCTPATCTENAFEESFCPDCGERFEREVPLSKLGHDFVATLTRGGRHDSWGSGFVSCARTLEDPDTHETTWACDFRIDFDGEDVDLTTLGGPPINGVVQYTDLTVSSTGAEDGGVKPIYLMDGDWSDGWSHAWYAGTRSHNEWVQFAFGTPIELTKIEYSVLNQYQTVDFYKYDPSNGVETLLKSIPIEKIDQVEKLDENGDVVTDEEGHVVYENAPSYQRLSVDFFVSEKDKKTIVDAIRMRIGDYVDPDSGAVTQYIGHNYGRPYHTIVCEVHPWGTIQGAGPLTHSPTTVMIFR